MDEFQEVIFVAEWQRITTKKTKNGLIKEVFNMLEPSIRYSAGRVYVVKGADIPAASRCVKFLNMTLK